MDWHSRMRNPCWKHQAREFDLYRDREARMLRWQMRTGKTKAAIDLICYRYEIGDVDSVVIAAPNNVHANWARRELPSHMWEGVPWEAITWDTTRSRNVSWRQEFVRSLLFPGLLFICVNREAFANKRFKEDFLRPFLRARRAFGFIGDETHNLSRRVTSKQSLAIRAVSRRAVFRRGLSGTITDNDPRHAFGQYELLGTAALGYDCYSDFEKDFVTYKDIYVAGGRKVKAVDQYVNQEYLRELLAPWTSVVLREECEDLPPLVPKRLAFDMHPDQKRLYNSYVLNGLARLDGGEVIPPKEGGAMKVALQQIASGWVVGEDGVVLDVVPPDENPRLNTLRSVLEQTGPKAVIWCRFREDIVRVHRACQDWGYKPVHYYGGTSKADRAKAEDWFRDDPRCGPMVGQPKACGEGLDFSAGTDIVHYSHLDGDLIGRKQANERCTRFGGRSVGLTDLIAHGSNDERLLDELDGKHERSEFLTGEGLRDLLRLVK